MNTSVTAAKFTSTETRALDLLASGFDAAQVASALGLSEGRISQLMSGSEFATELATKRYTQLAKHNETDNLADRVERKTLEMIEKSLPIIMDPMKLARIYGVVNSAKRRGASAPDAIHSQRRTITLNIPIAVVNKFQTNAANQVVEAGTQSESGTLDSQALVTIQSGSMQRLLNEHVQQNGGDVPVVLGREEGKVARRDERNDSESKGIAWRKAQGRERHDVLSECGFTHEIESTISSGKESNSSPSSEQ